MKYLKILHAVVLILLVLVLGACTDRFSGINKNDTLIDPKNAESPTIVSAKILPMLEFALPYSEGNWQLQIDLSGSSWIGYTGTPTPFGGNNNTTYGLLSNWNGDMWNSTYKQVMSNWRGIKTKFDSDPNFDGLYAVATIIKVFAMQRITDTYGPIIYSDYGSIDNTVHYDEQSKVYNLFFKDLDEALKILGQIDVDKNKEVSRKIINLADKTTYSNDPGTEVKKWVKFANSLRLRLAMRIVKVDPSKAKTEAEKAVMGGVIESIIDNAIAISPNYTKLGLYTITENWSDTRAGAVITSYLKGFNDPRLDKYFKTSTRNITGEADYRKEVLGIRGAISISAKADREDYSKIGDEIAATNQMVWITAAETYFLRAEGALRGWAMGGTAKDFYESGVKESFSQYGFSSITYLADGTSKQAPYVDVAQKDGKNDVPANSPELSTITVAWDDAATNEVNLERIITQKYLAIFPNAAEAWAEWRRTGYPKVFKAVNNTSGGKISTEDGVRRINFVQSETQNNSAGVSEAIDLLKKESSEVINIDNGDVGGTRVWWDKKGVPNI